MKKLFYTISICLSFFFSNSQTLPVDDATILYFPFDGSVKDYSNNKHNCEVKTYAYYDNDKNEFANSALSSGSTILVKNVNLGLKNEFSISFWFKADNIITNGKLIEINSQLAEKVMFLEIIPEEKKLITRMKVKNEKKSLQEYNSTINEGYKDDKWHFILVSFDGVKLITNVDDAYPAVATGVNYKTENNLSEGKKSFIEISKDFRGELDNLSILNKSINEKQEIEILKNRTTIRNGPKLKKFYETKDVLNYLDRRVFSFVDSNKAVAKFTVNASTFKVNGINKTYKYLDLTIISKTEAWLEYYDYDPNLYITIKVNSKDSTIDVSGFISPISGILNMLPKNTKEKIMETKDGEGWTTRGVTKIEMQNPRTDSFEEILLFTPGHYIEIRDFKDIRIEDPEILTLISGGKENLLFYKYAIFQNGQKTTTNTPQTELYIGKLELKNSSGTNTSSADAGLFFFYNNGKCSALEIKNKHCMCACRIYFSDGGPGLEFY